MGTSRDLVDNDEDGHGPATVLARIARIAR